MSYFSLPGNRGRLVALLVASSCALWSQSSAVGSLSITVKGPGGKVLSGATVRLDGGRGVATGITDPNGKFLFQNLLPGTVKVKVHAKDLNEETLSATVYVNQATTLNVTLKPVSSAVVVVVDSITPEVATPISTAVNGTDYGLDLIRTLPMIGDPLSALAAITPGTPSSGFNFNGSADTSNNFVVDGAEARSASGGLQNISVNRDLIEQIQVLQGGVSAKYGRFIGALFSTVTKSGTNELSGSTTHELTSASWNALARQSDYTKSAKVPRHVLDTQSWTLLGPIIKDKLFYALGYQITTPAATSVVYSSLRSKLFPTFSFTRQGYNELKDIKLDWQIDSAQRLSFAYNKYKTGADAGSSGQGIATYAGTAGASKTEKGYWTLGYTWVVAQDLNVDAKFSQTTSKSGGPGTGSVGGPGIITWVDKSTAGSGDIYDNGTNSSPLSEERIRTTGLNLSWFPEKHAVEAGFQNYTSRSIATGTSAPDAGYIGRTPSNYEIWFNGFTASPASMDPSNRVMAVNNNLLSRLVVFSPLTGQVDLRVTGLYVNDVWKPVEKISFNMGLRFDQYHYTSSPDGSTFSFNSFTPRLGAFYDLQDNNKHVFGVTYSEYAGLMNTGSVSNASVTGNVPVKMYNYLGSGNGSDAVNADGSINWSVWGKSAGLTGVNNPYFSSNDPRTSNLYKVDPDLKAPRSREIIGTYRYTDSRQSLMLSLQRKIMDRYVDDIWQGAAGTAAGQAVKLISNDPGGKSTYSALEGQYRNQLTPDLSVGGNFTWSYVKSNFYDQGGQFSARNNFGSLVSDDVIAPTGLQGYQAGSASSPFTAHADITYSYSLGNLGRVDVGMVGNYWAHSFLGYRSFTGATTAEMQSLGYAATATRMFYGSPEYWPEQYRFDFHLGYEATLYKKVKFVSSLDVTNFFNHMLNYYINHTSSVLHDTKGNTYANYSSGLPADWLTNPNYYVTASVPTSGSKDGSVGDYSAPRKIQVKLGFRF